MVSTESFCIQSFLELSKYFYSEYDFVNETDVQTITAAVFANFTMSLSLESSLINYSNFPVSSKEQILAFLYRKFPSQICKNSSVTIIY